MNALLSVIAILGILGMVAWAINEMAGALKERHKANLRYTCEATGKAWEQANRKHWSGQ